MKIYFCHVGKTKTPWIEKGELDYKSKLKRFGNIHIEYLKSGRSSTANGHRAADSDIVESYLSKAPRAFNFILDERGKVFSSKGFAKRIEQAANQKGPSIRFITGGPYGLSQELRDRSDAVVRLSDMVMTHELIRPMLMEQVYRAFTILRGESYHHE